MKKEFEYNLYTAELPVWYKFEGRKVHNLGVFEDERDAHIAANLVERILFNQSEMFNVVAVEEYNVKQILVPQSQVSYFKNVAPEYYSMIEEFLGRDYFTVMFAAENGVEELNALHNETVALIDKNASVNQVPVQRGEE